VEFYTSHEGLVLDYEQALTKYVPEHEKFYNLGAHILWIGDRTRALDGAHVEYFRGISNPIAMKVGPSMEAQELVDICKTLNPENELGKIVLISRFGDEKILDGISVLIQAVEEANLNVCWIADPMHGNTFKTQSGFKTRNFDNILSEIKKAHKTHKEFNRDLNGIHFELTGENVTECIGGSQGLTDEHLSSNYSSYCDPRLNYSQSLEIALLLSEILI
jgi:3-deoxy-7-phosphoheptulonate synthase